MEQREEGKICSHGICNCPAEEESDYCGPYCEQASRSEAVQLCDCGHPTCIG